MQNNDEQQNEEQDSFSILRVLGGVVVGMFIIVLATLAVRDIDTSSTVRTYDNGYGSSSVEIEGPLGKTVCHTKVVGNSSVTRCD